MNWSLDSGDIRWNLKELRLPPLRIPRVSSLSQQELERKAVELGKNDATLVVKKVLAENNSTADAIIRLTSVSPDKILACGQEKTGNLAYRYFFGYSSELFRAIAIQMAKGK